MKDKYAQINELYIVNKFDDCPNIHRPMGVVHAEGKPTLVEFLIYKAYPNCKQKLLIEMLNDWVNVSAEPIALKYVVSILKQILTAVNVLHKNGIVHRNINPESIYVN